MTARDLWGTKVHRSRHGAGLAAALVCLPLVGCAPRDRPDAPTLATLEQGATVKLTHKVTAADAKKNHELGYSLAMDGDTILAGAPWAGGGWAVGAAYVFVRAGSTWSQQAKLMAAKAYSGAYFGVDLALSGDHALVLASNYGDEEELYAFARKGGSWKQTQQLVLLQHSSSNDPLPSIAMDGATAVVGMPPEAPGYKWDAGVAYIMARSGQTWSQQAKLVAPSPKHEDFFGSAVAIKEGRVLVGAPGDDDHWKDAGAIYIYVRSGTKWSLEQKVTARGGVACSELGGAVALSGDALLAGCPESMYRGNWSGSALFYQRSGKTWKFHQQVAPGDGALAREFGARVALRGDAALVGDPENRTNGRYSGAAYIFFRNGGTWYQRQKLVVAGGQKKGSLGDAVALGKGWAAAGAHGDSSKAKYAGAVYLHSGCFTCLKQDGEACKDASRCVSKRCVNGVCCSTCVGGSTQDILLLDGATCTDASRCASGHCVDGVCCATACGGGNDGDCQVCSVSAGGLADGTCATLPSGAICRPVAGECDAVDRCDGVSRSCTADAVLPAGGSCRSSRGGCDPVEKCDGKSPRCPADALQPAGASCRAATGECNIVGKCLGYAYWCVVDSAVPDGEPCRGGAGTCQAGVCELKGSESSGCAMGSSPTPGGAWFLIIALALLATRSRHRPRTQPAPAQP